MARRILIIALLVIALVLPVITRNPYYLNTGIMIMLHILLSVSLFPMLRAGVFSIAHAAFMAIGAYSSALLAMHFGLNFWLTLPLAGLLAAVVAILLGLPTLRVKGLFLIIITLGFNEIVRLSLLSWHDVTGGAAGIVAIPRPTIPGLPPAEPHA